MSEKKLSSNITESAQDDNSSVLPSPPHPKISTTLDEVDLLLQQDPRDKVREYVIAFILAILMPRCHIILGSYVTFLVKRGWFGQ